MRFREFAADHQSLSNRLNIATLYVPQGSFPDLTACRLSHGRPTRIVAVRPLSPRFSGCSVDIRCSSAADALDLLAAWTGSERPRYEVGDRDGRSATALAQSQP